MYFNISKCNGKRNCANILPFPLVSPLPTKLQINIVKRPDSLTKSEILRESFFFISQRSDISSRKVVRGRGNQKKKKKKALLGTRRYFYR